LISVPVINKSDIAVNPRLLKLLIENPSALTSEVGSEGFAAEIIPDLIQIAEKTRGL